MLYAGNGGYAGAFLRFGIGARQLAMGNSFVAVADDGFSAFYNSAGLSFLEYKQFISNYSFMTLDRSLNYIGFAMPLKPTAGFSIGWLNADVDEIDGRDFDGNPTGNFSSSENAFYFSFSNKLLSNFSFGIGGKVLLHTLPETSAKGFGFDAGIIYKPFNNFSVGLQLKDILTKLTWNTQSVYEKGSTTVDEFPMISKLGIAYKYDWLIVSIEGEQGYHSNKKYQSERKFRIGAEASAKGVALRAGLDNLNFTLGAGLEFSIWKFKSKLDYAFLLGEVDEGSSNIFSWIFVF
jgi:hypothetical protein